MRAPGTFPKTLTHGHIAAFIGVSLLIGSGVGGFASILLGKSFLSKLRFREAALVFSAIESGPLTFARLHSAGIAQAQLNTLMATSGIHGRPIVGVRIQGGDEGRFEFARWRDPRPVSEACLSQETRAYTFTDAIHPYRITLDSDRCLRLPEERLIFRNALMVGLLVSLLTSLAGLMAILPVIDSFRKTRLMLQENQLSPEPSRIRFLPLRELALLAFRGFQAERNEALAKLAQQVAHDIRSPLAALDSILGSVNKLPEDERLIIRGSVSRIKDIANHLLEKNRGKGKDDAQENGASLESGSASASIVLLSSLIEPLITEKRLQFRSQGGIDIQANLDASSYGLFAKVEPREFKRVISNLINNSVEALKNKGAVTAHLASAGDWILFKVEDNGPGIPKEILAKLGQRGETHGKTGGSGLGLYHARTSLEAWGGSLEMESELGQGTTVTIKLPKAQPPRWFVSELHLPGQTAVGVLDDDPTIHQVWQGRFDSAGARESGIEIHHFSTPGELREWVKATLPPSLLPEGEGRVRGSAIYLMDYELLGFKETGLALIEELNLGPQAILVTSRFEEKAILEGCLRLGVRMIPKGMVGFVPIRIITENLDSGLRRNDEERKGNGRCAVLIDDDPLVQMTWRMAARAAGIEFSSFSSPQDFERAYKTIPPDAHIYLDSSFPNGQKGENFLVRLRELGFSKIALATGFEADSPHLKDLGCPVIGKEPPWA